MPSLPFRRLSRRCHKVWEYIWDNLNFFRVHILFFTFTPLIISGIFFASNGENPVSYIDSLFVCVSAMTVCGLATVDLSGLTPFQQFLLFLQMFLGSPVSISWVMVYIRRNFFAQKFKHIRERNFAHRLANKTHPPIQVKSVPWWRRLLDIVLHRGSVSEAASESNTSSTREHGRPTGARLRPDMIRRMDDAPKLVDPSGLISEGRPQPVAQGSSVNRNPSVQTNRTRLRRLSFSEASGTRNTDAGEGSDSVSNTPGMRGENASQQPGDRCNSPYDDSRHLTPPAAPRPLLHSQSLAPTKSTQMPRTHTIEFAPPPHPAREPINTGREAFEAHPLPMDYDADDRRSFRRPTMSIPHTSTAHTYRSRRTLHEGFGGFPMPQKIISSLFRRLFPKFQRRLTRTVTMPRTRTFASHHGTTEAGVRPVTYISFEAVVGPNSVFHRLTTEQLEELGGVEYRALSSLLWIVGGYHVLLQLLAFAIVAPYMSIPRWAGDFVPPALHRPISPVWFSGFQVVSSYTNTGLSLEDQSMVPFQQAYPMIVIMIILILAGNTAFPVFLRLLVWLLTQIVPRESRSNETLHFLLDHPRRCFVYLFPSHQTWFLVTVLIGLNVTDWISFLILDIGNSAITSIPIGIRIIIGLLQAAAVRASGFATVQLSALAPAVKVLYVIMMYVSVYPIAMSVRSTNVYEEKSLGIFDDGSTMDEEGFNPTGSRVTVWSRYLAMHMRKQLSFDMWWLGFALFLVCIVERGSLDDPSKQTWFSIFTILFELVSAYGTVGLSLGVPYANYSFSGALTPLSKVIVCAVMLRGRHRGLPVAIDRAVMLPLEFQEEEVAEQVEDEGAELDAEARPTSDGNSEPINEKSPPAGAEQKESPDWSGSDNEQPHEAQHREGRPAQENASEDAP
ncbi:hypothetical protein OBBRIDRAFT_793172 [Obba rivulosa]|uniref:Potassium transport protein n=1 Tax=Obba rivulosa TaxID=1052685 RepID=A0A8E2AYM9_9APHY|nr:hypothetical protein OBBRIDRAFT_793172 [Obba rivulosa]